MSIAVKIWQLLISSEQNMILYLYFLFVDATREFVYLIQRKVTSQGTKIT